MIINHNIAALNTHRQLGMNNTAASKNLEKLSSGLKINRAGDDAAGLAISEKMRAQIRGLDMAQKNAQDGISLIQTAEGALNETHDILQRMRELSVQASNDTNTLTDRKELQKELNQLIEEIDRISTDTEFNTKKLLNGDLATAGNQTPAVADATASQTSGSSGNIAITDPSTFTGETGTWTLATTDGTSFTLDKGDGNAQAITFTAGKATVDGIELDISGITAASNDEWTIEVTAAGQAEANGTTGGAVIHIGANSNQSLTVDINKMDSTTLGGGTSGATPTAADATASQTSGASGNIAITDPSTFTGETGTWTLATTDGTSFTLDKGDGNAQAITFTAGKATVDGIELDISGITAASNDEWTIEVTAAGQAGENDVTIGSLTVADVDNATEASGGILSQAGADAAIENIQKAIDQVSAERSKLGAFQNRLEHTINNLGTSSENLTAAESRIRDVDMAKEMMEFTKNNILTQAAQAMLAQSFQMPQGVLQLLR